MWGGVFLTISDPNFEFVDFLPEEKHNAPVYWTVCRASVHTDSKCDAFLQDPDDNFIKKHVKCNAIKDMLDCLQVQFHTFKPKTEMWQ